MLKISPPHIGMFEPLRTPPLNNADYYHHKRYDQQNMNNSTECVRSDKPEQPENQENHSYCPKHFYFTSFKEHANNPDRKLRNLLPASGSEPFRTIT